MDKNTAAIRLGSRAREQKDLSKRPRRNGKPAKTHPKSRPRRKQNHSFVGNNNVPGSQAITL